MTIELEDAERYDFAPAGPTYSQAVKAGNIQSISGSTAQGIESQGKSMMEQLDVILGRLVKEATFERAGLGKFAELTVFVTTISDYQADLQKYQKLFAEHFQEQ